MDLRLLVIAALSVTLCRSSHGTSECGAQLALDPSDCLDENGRSCSGRGSCECGGCKCQEGYVGRLCECSTDEIRAEDLDANCRKDNGTDVCSNNGDCICGTCECKKRENPAEVYSGKYCECDNFNCDRSGNKLCGGHGRCECRVCVCDANYTGSACDCSLDTSTCLASNGQICNGRGTCECGICKCTNRKFQGPTCEICPTCPGVCSQHRECVQCRAFQTGEKKDTCERDCSDFHLIKVKETKDLPHPFDHDFPLSHCKERDGNDCWFYYTYAVRNGIKEVHVVERPDTDCLSQATYTAGGTGTMLRMMDPVLIAIIATSALAL